MAYLMSRMPAWQGKYPASDTTHFDDLQMRSDIYEHMYRLPRHEAEARAHGDYRKEQIAKAAGHHWNGMKSAHAAGNVEAAKKHGVMYALALHQLGHKDLLNPPPEVVEAAKDPKSEIAHFKAHPGDAFSMPPEEPGEPQQRGKLENQVKAPKPAAPMAKAEEEAPVVSEKCGSCGGPYHPASGFTPQGIKVCGTCTHHFLDWMKGHTAPRKKGPDFYREAGTSIKPGDGDKK